MSYRIRLSARMDVNAAKGEGRGSSFRKVPNAAASPLLSQGQDVLRKRLPGSAIPDRSDG